MTTPSRKRRGPSERRPGGTSTRARRPYADTLSLAKFRELLSEPVLLRRGDDLYPKQQEALERRKDAIRNGDLLALYSALQWCFQPSRTGFSFEDARLNPKLDPNFRVCEIPAWLLGEVFLLLCNGLNGKWPKGQGSHARASRRQLDAWRDTVRTWKVLQARENGVPWARVFEHVANTLQGAGSPKTIEGAYCRVVKKLETDPEYYRRIGAISPHIADVAVGIPESSQ